MIHTTATTDDTTANDTASSSRIAKSGFRNPHYDCQYDDASMKLTVYIPGVVASGVDITMRGPDLTITARKERFVRPNWGGLQLERAQRDYLLRLRIGCACDPAGMTAELHNGILTLNLPGRDLPAHTMPAHIMPAQRQGPALAEAV
ncbi:MAG: Hsp20/alpha crystallin family protein [Opitutaceae bacterium]|jgi:HSP20 family molecular chaperone IbpA|nr:Hsp20/alpha crystallin family protein [Opitutaceae bacterium]